MAEEVGFDAVVVPDPFHPWVDDRGAAGFAWSWLGAAAVATSSIELITTVTCPLFRYHPAVVAQAAATMDRLSGGRFVLGVGTGDAIHDAPLGWQGVSTGERQARLREALQLMRRLWSGAKVAFEGRYYRVDRARLYSPPEHKLRVFVAAHGPRSAALAGEMADGLITSVKDPQETQGRVLVPFRQAAAVRAATVLAGRWCVLAGDDQDAWEALAPLRGLRVPGRAQAVDPEDLRRQADRLGPEKVLARFARARDAAELVEVYRPLVEDLGADYVALQVASVDPDRTVRLLASEVLPSLKNLGGEVSGAR